MPENIIIRRAMEEDLDILRKLGIQTFSETFGPHNSVENLHNYLESRFNVQQLQEELQNPDSAFFLAVVHDGEDHDEEDMKNSTTMTNLNEHIIAAKTPIEKIAGYLKLNFGNSQTEIREYDGIEIERIYALKEFHGKKIGQRLFETALAVAQQRKANYIWLGVWEKNQRAIAFYIKNGFVEFDQHIFRLGNDLQTDIMMKKFCS